MVPVGQDFRHWPQKGRRYQAEPFSVASWAVIPMIEVTAEALAAHPFLHSMSVTT